MVAAEYSGLSVAQLQDLRRRIAEDATFTIVKNTLARQAVERSGREEMLPHLSGPTGIVWVTGDVARAAKVMSEFAKESEDLFSPKGGLLDGAPMDTAQFTALSKLPPRDELVAKLAGGVAAPLFALSGLSQPLTKLLYGLMQLRDQMPADAASPEEQSAAEPEPASSESVSEPEATEAESSGSESESEATEAESSESESEPEAVADGDDATE